MSKKSSQPQPPSQLTPPAALNIVNIGYDSTNYYVLTDQRPRLLIDVGFPLTLPKLQAQAKRVGIALNDLPYLLCTHYHPDHAGLVPEIQRQGIKLIVVDLQIEAIPLLTGYLKPEHHYTGIDLKSATVIALSDSRAFLMKLGIAGQIIATPGHSDDSVTLILDSGAAFTGDLTHPMIAGDDPDSPITQIWHKVRAAGGKTIYGGHGPVWQLPDLAP